MCHSKVLHCPTHAFIVDECSQLNELIISNAEETANQSSADFKLVSLAGANSIGGSLGHAYTANCERLMAHPAGFASMHPARRRNIADSHRAGVAATTSIGRI